MSRRINERQKEISNLVDDPLRRRGDEQVQIRKATRDAQLAKRREQQASNSFLSSNAANSEENDHFSQELLDRLLSNDDKLLFSGVQKIRKLLSTDAFLPIQMFVDMGLISKFVEIIETRTDHDEIRFEAGWALTNVASGTHLQTLAVVNANGIRAFTSLLYSNNDKLIEQGLWGLGNIAGDCTDFRTQMIREGTVDVIFNVLSRIETDNISFACVKYGVWCLSNLFRGSELLKVEHVVDAIHLLTKVFTRDDEAIFADSLWCCYFILDLVSNKGIFNLLNEFFSCGLANNLIRFIAHPKPSIITPAIRCIGTILTSTDDHTQMMINYGVVKELVSILGTVKISTRKEAIWALSNIAAGNDKHIDELFNCGVFEILLDIMENCDFNTTRECAWTICNAINSCRDEQCVKLVELGVIKRLSGIMDIHDHRVQQIVLEATAKILQVGQRLALKQECVTDNPFIIKFEEASAFDKLEELQFWDDKPVIQKLAVDIITTYLDSEVVDQPIPIPEDTHVGMFGGMN